MNDARPPVEVTTKYATTVDELQDAWKFVMEHIDKVGPDPSVQIKPIWWHAQNIDEECSRHFEVCVEGIIEQEQT